MFHNNRQSDNARREIFQTDQMPFFVDCPESMMELSLKLLGGNLLTKPGSPVFHSPPTLLATPSNADTLMGCSFFSGWKYGKIKAIDNGSRSIYHGRNFLFAFCLF